jgi:hypothetical protein
LIASVGKLSGLHESLAMIAKGPMPQIQAADEFEDTAMLEALNALVTAVNGITIPELKIDLNSAIGKLVKAINGITFPEEKPIDLSPLIEAIKGVSLEVEIPEHKPMEPCAYTFTVQRNELGVLTGVVAVPGIVEAPEKTDKASYE